MGKMYEKMLCETLDIRQETVISERQETNKAVLQLTQCIAVIEFPSAVQGGETQAEHCGAPKLRRPS